MGKRMWGPAGALVAAAGLVFTLQGIGVITGSSMTGKTFWALAGPAIIIVGLGIIRLSARGRGR